MYLAVPTARSATMSPIGMLSMKLPPPFQLPPEAVFEPCTSTEPSNFCSFGGFVTSLIVPPIECHGGRRQRHLIDIEAHRRRRAAGGGQSAHLVLGLPGTGRASRQTRH